MNARTQLSANGDIPIPQDVRDRLHWAPGTPLEVVETAEGVSIRKPKTDLGLPRSTLADLDALPRYKGPPKSIEEISSLSDQAILWMMNEGDRH